MVFRLMSLLLIAAPVAPATSTSFQQNCASRGLCGVPFQFRPPELHATDPGDPSGHLRPLGDPGFDQSWDGPVDEFDGEIDPELFWTKYYPHRPFVMRGAGKSHPAFSKWKDDQYLKDHFGEFKVKTENKHEDRLTDYCGMRKMGTIVSCPSSVLPYVESYMNISSFLSQYRKHGHDSYVITQLPTSMAADVMVSSSWNCGMRPQSELLHNPAVRDSPWKTQLYEANLWINYNEGQNFSSSVIHYDMNHQMMCMYEGSKEWFFWDLRENIEHIPTWSGYYSKDGHVAGSDDSPIDGERVDLKTYPQFNRARWTNTTIHAGDCLYTPAHIMHYVRSTGRNIAAMYMFQSGTKYNPSQCATGSKGSEPLDRYDLLWEFPGTVPGGAGWNQVKMGFPDWKRQIREPMLELARRDGDAEHIWKRDILHWLSNVGHTDQMMLELDAVFRAIGDDVKVPVSQVVSSAVFDEFFRNLAIGMEIDDEEQANQQELDTRVLRYDLIGKNAVKQQLTAHQEL